MTMGNLRSFKTTYGAELMNASSAGMLLTELFEWDGLFKKTLDPLGKSLIDFYTDSPKAERESLREQLRLIPEEQARFAQISIDKELGTNADLKIPQFNLDLSLGLNSAQVKKFIFGNVKSKRLTGELRIEIKALLDQLKEKDFKTYKKELRNRWVAETYFYSDLAEIELDSSVDIDAQLGARLKELTDVDVSVVQKSGSNKKIVLKGDSSPFAVELVQGRLF